jgi:hypothetical protein
MVFGEMSSSEISNDPRHPSSIICPSGRWETCSSFRYRHSSLLVRSSPASYCNGVRSDRARNTPKPASQEIPKRDSPEPNQLQNKQTKQPKTLTSSGSSASSSSSSSSASPASSESPSSFSSSCSSDGVWAGASAWALLGV